MARYHHQAVFKHDLFFHGCTGTGIELQLMSISLQCLLGRVQPCEFVAFEHEEGELTNGGKSRIGEIDRLL